MSVAEDIVFMRRAIRLADTHSRAGDGGPFGAVIVSRGIIIGRGWNRVTSASDPTAHAEVMAIRAACRKLRTFSLKGCSIYTSCEPCPMCLGAIYWARLDRLVYAASRTDAAAIGFDDAFLYREMALSPDLRKLRSGQLLRDEAAAMMQTWQALPGHTLY